MAVKSFNDVPREDWEKIIEKNYEFFTEFENWNFDDVWDMGLDEIKEFCEEKSKDQFEFSIDETEIHWSSSSQGPYYERHNNPFISGNINKKYGEKELFAEAYMYAGNYFEGTLDDVIEYDGNFEDAEGNTHYDIEEAGWPKELEDEFKRDEEYVLQTMKDIQEKIWTLILLAERNDIEPESYADYLVSNRYGYNDETEELEYMPTEEEHDREVGQLRLPFEESIKNYIIHKENNLKKIEERINNNPDFPYPEVNKSFLYGEVKNVNRIQKNGAEAPKADSMREGFLSTKNDGNLETQKADSVATVNVSNRSGKDAQKSDSLKENHVKMFFENVDWEGARLKMLKDPRTFTDTRKLMERKGDKSAPYQIYVGKGGASKYGQPHDDFKAAQREADKLFDKMNGEVSVIIKSIKRNAEVYNILGDDIDPELYGPSGTRVSKNLDGPILTESKRKKIREYTDDEMTDYIDQMIDEAIEGFGSDAMELADANDIDGIAQMLGYQDAHDYCTSRWTGEADCAYDSWKDSRWDESTKSKRRRIQEGIESDIFARYLDLIDEGYRDREARYMLTEEFGPSEEDDNYASFIDMMYEGGDVDDPMGEYSDDLSAIEARARKMALSDSTKSKRRRMKEGDIEDNGDKFLNKFDRYKGNNEWDMEGIDDEIVTDEEMDNYSFNDFDDPNRDGRIEQAIRHRDYDGWDDEGDDDVCPDCGEDVELCECHLDRDFQEVDDPLFGYGADDTWDADQTDWDDDDWDAHDAEVGGMIDPHSIDIKSNHEFDAVIDDEEWDE